jgi:hypothetical protein
VDGKRRNQQQYDQRMRDKRSGAYVKPEQAIELGCEECRWYRPVVIACGYIFRDQIIQRADGVLTCNKKKPVKETE